jgi:rhodanese-related sulfurtransferase
MSVPEISFVDPDTLAEWIDRGEATVFDVREQHEWDEARIPGATLVPLSEFDPAAIVAPDTSKIVLHCKSGVRCGMAAEQLAAAGVTRPLWRLQGGIMNWAQSGKPIER